MVQQPPGPPPGGMQPPPPPPPGQPPQAPIGPPKPQFDMSKLPLADIIVAGCSLIFVILSGVGWYKSKLNITEDIFYGEEPSLSLGGGAMSILAMVFGILLLIFALVMIANRYLEFIPMQLPTGLIYLGLTALILAFMIIGIFVKPDVSIAGYEIGTLWSEVTGEGVPGADLSWVMWVISLIFAVGIGVGGFLKMGES